MYLIRLDKGISIKNNISRERAKVLVKEGSVKVNDKVVKQPSFLIKSSDFIETTRNIEFVGRGYLKIEEAFNKFNFSIDKKIVLDVGSSTGGFTQFCLEKGAEKVIAIDVGKDQLVDSLKSDKRVISLESTDIREVKREDIGDIDLIVVDVSFISITKIVDNLICLLNDTKGDKDILCLIKPQFELGSKVIGRAGIVKKVDQILLAINGVIDKFNKYNFFIKNIDLSPISGKKGNIEIISIFSNGCDNIKLDYLKDRIESRKKEKK